MKIASKTVMLTALFAFGLSAQSISVINGARFELKYPVSPGSYAQVYGEFAGVPTATAPAIPLPNSIEGVQVFVNDVAAPLYGVSSTVISFVVPNAAQAGRANVRVVRNGSALATGTADIVPVSPGVFFVLGDALAQGGILNQASQYAIQTAAATRGSTIQIFATGQGPVSAPVVDGSVPSALTTATGTTKVFISVDEAQVTFSGLSPQFPGLWQINAVVPNKSYISGRVPLVVTINGIPSNQVSFWVAQ